MATITTNDKDLTIIDFGIKREDIYTGNLKPEQIKVLDSCDYFEQRSAFIYGFKDKKRVFEAYAGYWNAEEIEEHHQYFEDKSRTKPHWEINKNGFFLF